MEIGRIERERMIEPTGTDGKSPMSASHGVTISFRLRWPTTAAFGLLVGITMLVVGNVLVTHRVGLFRVDGEIRTIQDFASHTRFTGAVWKGELREVPGSLYGVPAHLRFMREWAGEPTDHALPFGYSPTMLWVLGPFSAIPLPIAYVLWSLAGLGAAIWIVLQRGVHRIVALMAFVTPAAVACVALGQTAILASAGLFFLMNRSLRIRESGTRAGAGSWLASGAVLWALGAKPPVGIAAAAALLALRDYKTVLTALGLTVLSTVALAPWIGFAWPMDYLALLSTYNRTQANPAFVWSLVLASMTNLRAVLSVDLGLADALASEVSNGVWAGALAAVIWAGRTGRIGNEAVWALAVLCYLLLCSHVTPTEDLMLLLVPAAMAPWSDGRGTSWTLLAWLLVPLGLLFTPAIGPAAGVRPAPLFFVKLLLLAWVLAVSRRGTGTITYADSASSA
jgi:hypothetical protein